MMSFYDVKIDGSKIVIRFNVREYIMKTVNVPIKYLNFELKGDVLEVVAEVDTEQVLSRLM
jgi:hypothetical protein